MSNKENNQTEQDGLVKIHVIGGSGNGRMAGSDLVTRFVKDEYMESFSPDIEDKNKTVNIGGRKIKSLIFQAPEKMIGMDRMNTRNKAMDAIVLVCDLSDPKSIKEMEQVYSRHVSEVVKYETPIIIIGSLSDESHQNASARSSLKEFVDSNKDNNRNIHYFEASAKSGEKVNEAFECAIKEALMNKNGVYRLKQDDHKNIEKMVHLLNSDNNKKLPFGLGQKRFEAMAQEKVNSMINKLGKSEVKAYQAELKRQIPANTKTLSAGDKVRFDLSQKLDERKNAIEKAEQTYSDKNRLAKSD